MRPRTYVAWLRTPRLRQLQRRRVCAWSARILGLGAVAFLLLHQAGVS